MFAKRFVSALVVGAALSFGASSFASAADLQVKAPPRLPDPWVLDVHGFFDISWKNAYITPRGLLVHRTGLTTQILSGLALDLYKDKAGFINDVSVYGGVWNDLWSDQHHPAVGSWNEFDWFVGTAVKFASNWKFTAEYIEFVPPAASFITSFPTVERNLEFGLFYDDSAWWGGAPFAINPYVKLFYEVKGPSTVVLGNSGKTYDVELGIVPTYDFTKSGTPLAVSVPTWVTVGPSNYWNRNDGTTNVCGALSNQACALGNSGVFSTGIKGKLALDAVVPKRLGNWYLTAGFQYYHIINDALLAAQQFTGAAGGAANVLGTYPNAHRDVGVGYASLGFNF